MMTPSDRDELAMLVRNLRGIAADLREALEDLRAQQGARPRYVTLKEATRLFGIAPRTLRHHIRAGELRGYAPGGAKMLVAVDEIEQFIRSAAVDRDRDLDA